MGVHLRPAMEAFFFFYHDHKGIMAHNVSFFSFFWVRLGECQPSVLNSILPDFFSLLQPLHAHIYLIFFLGISAVAAQPWCWLHPTVGEQAPPSSLGGLGWS